MSVNKYNSEGYVDPTAYEALTIIEKEVRAKKAYRPGCIPIAPHLYFPQFMDDNIISERNLALYMDIILLSKCAELWVFGDYISKGMSIEIARAKKKNQPIRYFTVGCEEVRK